MKGFAKWIIILFVLACCVQGVSAFSVSTIIVEPTGALIPNQPVTVAFKIDAAGTGPESTDISLLTDLDNQRWTYTLIVNAIESPRPVHDGKTLDISGFELSYKKDDKVDIRVTLEAVTPSVTQTTNKTIIRICQKDTKGNVIERSCVERGATVVDITQVQKLTAEREAALQTFRNHIDEYVVLDIDTTPAESKYSEAKTKINSAKEGYPQNKYIEAINDLNAAQNLITDGEKALDRAYAEKEVAAAQVPIGNVDAIIGWFKGNKSTADNPQLPAIITQREVAVGYISAANDAIASGNFAQARVKAQDAYNKGNESYNDALVIYKDALEPGWFPKILPNIKLPGLTWIIVGVVVVALAAVGYVIYRKRTQWDELG